MNRHIALLSFLSYLLVSLPTRAANDEAAEKRQQHGLAACMTAPIDVEKGSYELPFLLKTLGELASPKDKPEIKLKIEVNTTAFENHSDVKYDFEKAQVTFGEGLTQAPLKQVLDTICGQFHAGCILKKDHIEILPLKAIRAELKLPASDRELAALVIRVYDNVPLEKALQDLAKTYERTVVMSPLAKNNLKSLMSAQLINLPFAAAVEKLAYGNGLAMALVADEIIVTTSKDARERTNKRMRILAAGLDSTIPEIEVADIALPFLLDTLGALASEPGSQMEPIKRVKIDLYPSKFQEVKKDFDLEREQIKYTKNLVKRPLREGLAVACQQLSAGCVLRRDFIEIVPLSAIRAELKLPKATDKELSALVIRFYDDVAFETALGDLARKEGRPVELSPKVGKEAKKIISAELVNLPFDAAVEKLAGAAGLGVTRSGDKFIVTTKEDAASSNPQSPKK